MNPRTWKAIDRILNLIAIAAVAAAALVLVATVLRARGS